MLRQAGIPMGVLEEVQGVQLVHGSGCNAGSTSTRPEYAIIDAASRVRGRGVEKTPSKDGVADHGDDCAAFV